MSTQTLPSTPDTHPDAVAPWRSLNHLWASALVLFALVLIQAQPIWGLQPFGNSEAQAGMVASSGAFTILTADSGNEDVVVLLDGRNEMLYVYRTDMRSGVQLFQRVPVAQVFADARARSVGRP